MALDDFTWVPETADLDEEPRVSKTEFGDGYSQITPDGINDIKQMWSLAFNDVEKDDADAIIAFLRLKKSTSFLWTPPGESQIKVRCPKWRRQIRAPFLSNITMTFEQWFGP